MTCHHFDIDTLLLGCVIFIGNRQLQYVGEQLKNIEHASEVFPIFLGEIEEDRITDHQDSRADIIEDRLLIRLIIVK